MTARSQKRWDDLPEFATDEQIGAVMLGPTRAKEWCVIALRYERRGLPQIDPVHRGRFVPAVRQWYYARYGIGQPPDEKADGEENWEKWEAKRRA